MGLSRKICLLLLLASNCLVGDVKGWCRERCTHEPFPTCDKLYKNSKFEKKLSEDECQFNATTKGKNKILCCNSAEGYKQYKAQKLAWTLSGAEENEYPHQVKLVAKQDNNKVVACGGSIYNHEWIITAAHCIQLEDRNMTRVGHSYVIAGKSDVKSAKDEDKYWIAEIIMHDKWISKKIGQGHDIALLRLNRSLNLEVGKIQPIRLAEPEYELEYGGNGIIVGWGNVHKMMGVGSTDLLEAQVPIHHMTKSARLSFDQSQGGVFVMDQHVSVGGEEGGVTVGQGDSGGPLICADNNNKAILCGIASYKYCPVYHSCKQGNYYIRVDKFYGWIMENLKNAEQEEEMLFDLPIFPLKIKNKNVPPYVVSIAGRHQSCTGVLVTPKLIATSAQCMSANGEIEELGRNIALGHFNTETQLKLAFSGMDAKFKPNISANVANFFERPLALHDIGFFILEESVPEEHVIKLPPVGYEIKGPVVEYTMNDKVTSVEARRFLPMDRNECALKMKTIDDKLELSEQHLCMRQEYGAEANCDRDVGGPLVCDGYLCGIKIFHACQASGFPEIFNDFTTNSDVRQTLEAFKKKFS